MADEPASSRLFGWLFSNSAFGVLSWTVTGGLPVAAGIVSGKNVSGTLHDIEGQTATGALGTRYRPRRPPVRSAAGGGGLRGIFGSIVPLLALGCVPGARELMPESQKRGVHLNLTAR